MFIGSCKSPNTCNGRIRRWGAVALVYDRTKANYFYDRYYDGGVSSVYFWDLDDGFAGVILLKKSTSCLQPTWMTATALPEASLLPDFLF